MRNITAAAFCLATLSISSPSLQAEPSRLTVLDASGEVTRVVGAGESWRLERTSRDGQLQESVPLPARPHFLQAGPSAAVAGDLRPEEKRWAVVAPRQGKPWRVPGEPVRVHLSRGGKRLLVQAEAAGAATRVYTVSGELLAELPVGASPDRSTTLSLAGDAVLIAPTGEAPAEDLRLVEVGSGRQVTLRYEDGDVIADAVALDAHRVLTLGGGTLRLRILDDEAAPTAAWGVHPPGGYWTLLGVSDDGRRILVSREGGWDLLNETGEVVFQLAHGAPGLPLGEGDLRGLEPRLLGTGDLLLVDRQGGRRWIARFAGEAKSLRIVALPPDAVVDAAGRWLLAAGGAGAVPVE